MSESLGWTYTFHRFVNQAAYQAAVTAAGWNPYPDYRVWLNPFGDYWDSGALVPGFHVNVGWQNIAMMPQSFFDTRIFPNIPGRLPCGCRPMPPKIATQLGVPLLSADGGVIYSEP